MSLAKLLSRLVCLYFSPRDVACNGDLKISFLRGIFAKAIASWHSCYRTPRKSHHENNTATSGYVTHISFTQGYRHDGIAHGGNFKIHQDCKMCPLQKAEQICICVPCSRVGWERQKTMKWKNNIPPLKKWTLYPIWKWVVILPSLGPLSALFALKSSTESRERTGLAKCGMFHAVLGALLIS